MLDLALAIAHHIFVFVLFGIVFAEFFALRPGLGRDAVTRLARLDLFYGIDAGLVLIAGFSRVFFAAKGWHYYEHNAFFWAKLGTFALIGALSVPPTLAYLRWQAAGAAPDDRDVKAGASISIWSWRSFRCCSASPPRWRAATANFIAAVACIRFRALFR